MSVSNRLQIVNQRIQQACARVGRSPDTVRLLAVSKLQDPAKIQEAIRYGQLDFAENYVQEAQLKQEQVTDERVRWHFIGRIQSNKVKMLMQMTRQRFAVLHSVDRFSIAHHLDKLSAPARQPIFIQYNVAEESSKGGASELELENLVRGVSGCAHLSMLGLMVMPPLHADPEQSRPHFRAARETMQRLKQALRKELADHPFDQLSMGTSHDFEVAIEEGAHWVRIGSEIFGERVGDGFEQEMQ